MFDAQQGKIGAGENAPSWKIIPHMLEKLSYQPGDLQKVGWGCLQTKRPGKQKAIVAIARKIFVVIWHVLTKAELDHHAQPVAIARSLMTWSSAHHLAQSQRKPRIEFVRERLELLGILDQVTSFQANRRSHSLIPNP